MREDIVKIVKQHDEKRGGLIWILETIQNKYGYLSVDALKVVSDETGRSMVDLYGMATFYKSFSLEERGKHIISVCLGTACHVRNAPMIAEEFERQLEIKAGGTTLDKEFTLQTVACLGACALGPIVVVDGHYFSNVDTAEVRRILKKTRRGLDAADRETDGTMFPVRVNCPRCNHSLMDRDYQVDDYPSIRLTASFERNHGWIRLSSLYGSYTIASENEIPMDTIVYLFCPHCHAELIGSSNCSVCGAPFVPMIVREGGMVQICSRRGCKEHMLDLDGVNF